jgi:hypothetical protein
VIYDGMAGPLAARFAEGLVHLLGSDAVVSLRDPKDLPVVGGLLKRTAPGVRNFSRSDHVPFWEAGIPAIMVTDTANSRYADYHQPTDTHEKLDYDRVAAIVVAAAGAVAREAVLVRLGERPASTGPGSLEPSGDPGPMGRSGGRPCRSHRGMTPCRPGGGRRGTDGPLP